MDCGRSNCTFISVIIGIIAGVLLGVLYSLGFVSTGIIFWVYLIIGVLGVLLSPIYAANASCKSAKCFCKNRVLVLVSALGAIIASAAGLIVAPFASTVVVGIVLGLATLFTVMLISSVVCVVNCQCRD